jgi:hypothetical protein
MCSKSEMFVKFILLFENLFNYKLKRYPHKFGEVFDDDFIGSTLSLDFDSSWLLHNFEVVFLRFYYNIGSAIIACTVQLPPSQKS